MAYSIETEKDEVISSADSSQKMGGGRRASKTHIHMGRVTGVVSDSSDKNGAVTFIFVSGKGKKNDYNVKANKDGGGSLAIPLFPGFRDLPLKNEFIFLIPSVAKVEMPLTPYFYISAINSTNTGVYYPDAEVVDLMDDNGIDLGKGISETSLEKLRKLLLQPGDASLEGRFGNTIRLGNSNTLTPYRGEQNSPIIIIRNGQKVEENILGSTFEDIDGDNSSIYLTKGQTIPITVVCENLDTFGVKSEEGSNKSSDDVESLELTEEEMTDADVSAVVDDSEEEGDGEHGAETETVELDEGEDESEGLVEEEEEEEEIKSKDSNDEAFAEEGSNIVFSDTSSEPTPNAETIIKTHRGYSIKKVLSSDADGNPEQVTEHYVIPDDWYLNSMRGAMGSLFGESDTTAISYFEEIIDTGIDMGEINDLTE